MIYGCMLVLSALLPCIWLMVRSKKQDKKQSAGLALLSCVLGFLCARIFYFIVRSAYLWQQYGFTFFTRTNMDEYSATGAVLGVLLSILLISRTKKIGFLCLLDQVAPCAFLSLALFRLAEFFSSPQIGTGGYVENTLFQRFPFAVVNEWGEWYYAVFMAEALAALCGMVLSLHKGKMAAGDRVLGALLVVCLCQVFLESLRGESVKWGFVRVQQLCAMLGAAAVTIYECVRNKKSVKICLSIITLCVVVCVGVEFALDKTGIPKWISYTAMNLSLCMVGVFGFYCMKKNNA